MFQFIAYVNGNFIAAIKFYKGFPLNIGRSSLRFYYLPLFVNYITFIFIDIKVSLLGSFNFK
jgi:hypothetical protein